MSPTDSDCFIVNKANMSYRKCNPWVIDMSPVTHYIHRGTICTAAIATMVCLWQGNLTEYTYLFLFLKFFFPWIGSHLSLSVPSELCYLT